MVCQRPSKAVVLLMNVILHVMILLLILSVFFFTYVSKLSKDKFEDEINDLVTSQIQDAFQKYDRLKIIKNMLKNYDWSKVAQQYNQPSEATRIQNNWLIGATIGVLAFLVIVFVTIVVVNRSYCADVPVGELLLENIITFTLIGILEVMFFLYIAKKFIPTAPSLLLHSIKENVIANLSK